MVLTLVSFTVLKMSQIVILFIVAFLKLWMLQYYSFKFKYIGLWYVSLVLTWPLSLLRPTNHNHKVELPPAPRCISPTIYAGLENWLLEALCGPLWSRILLSHGLHILTYEIQDDTLCCLLLVWILMTDLFAYFLFSKTTQVNVIRPTYKVLEEPFWYMAAIEQQTRNQGASQQVASWHITLLLLGLPSLCPRMGPRPSMPSAAPSLTARTAPCTSPLTPLPHLALEWTQEFLPTVINMVSPGIILGTVLLT